MVLRVFKRLIILGLVAVFCVACFACGKEEESKIRDVIGVIQYTLDDTDDEKWAIEAAIWSGNVWLFTPNVKFEFSGDKFNLSEIDVVKPLRYWQSVVGFLDGIVYGEDFVRTDRLVFAFDDTLEDDSVELDIKDGRIRMGISIYLTCLTPEKIMLSGAYSIFNQLGRLYSHTKEGNQAGFVLLNNISVSSNILALLATNEFTDMSSRAYVGGVYNNERFLNHNTAFEVAMSLTDDQLDYANFNDGQRLSCFVLLMHRFGADGFRRLYSSYATLSEEQLLEMDDKIRRDELLVRASKAFGYDMRDYFEHFRMHNSFDARDAVGKLKKSVFYPVAVKGVGGRVSLRMSEGRMIELDFEQEDSIMSLYGEVSFKSFEFTRGVKSLDNVLNNDVKISFMPSVSKFDSLEVLVKTPSEVVKLTHHIRSVLSDSEAIDCIKYDYSLKKATKIKGERTISSHPYAAILAIKITVPIVVVLAGALIIILAIKKHPKDNTGRTVIR